MEPNPDVFEPTREAALARLAEADPGGYTQRRNYLDGPVTRLSPWVTHGMLDLPEALDRLRRRHTLAMQHKLVFEFGWREYFQHVWRHLGGGILADIRPPVSAVAYADKLPADIVQARTGVPVIDATVRALYDTGYVHNHARMWLASYMVHLRKVHWRTGADWMVGHLLDGDLASNHLSWQWVAGTFSAKPYLFNAGNVAQYAPALASPGTAIDRGYAELEALARGTEAVGAEPGAPAKGVKMPLLRATPGRKAAVPKLPRLRGAAVALVHPWSLGERPECELAIGVVHLPFHARFPWSARRWDFVMARMRAITDHVWVGDLADLLPELTGASLVARRTYNPGYAELLGGPMVRTTEVPRIVADPDELCGSFTRFWNVVAPPPPVPARDIERELARKLKS